MKYRILFSFILTATTYCKTPVLHSPLNPLAPVGAAEDQNLNEMLPP
jgi:hypothetical protein